MMAKERRFKTRQTMDSATGGLVETRPDRYRTLIDPIIASTRSYSLISEPVEAILGIALLSRSGGALYEYGQLLHHMSHGTGTAVLDTLDRTTLVASENSSTSDQRAHGETGSGKGRDLARECNGTVEIAGRPFIVWKHERSTRLYATSRDRTWSLFSRSLSIGVIVVVHAKALPPQSFIPELERFCDRFARR